MTNLNNELNNINITQRQEAHSSSGFDWNLEKEINLQSIFLLRQLNLKSVSDIIYLM